VTIADLDHPLAAILGTWTATGQSYFEDDGVLQDWSVTILKDSKDLSKVWFVNLVPYVSGTPVNPFGIVNSDMTEIRIPVHQVLATSGSYGLIRLESYYGPDGEEYIEDGGFITITIAPNKKSMVIQDELLAAVYRNADATGLLGYFEAIASGTIMKKD